MTIELGKSPDVNRDIIGNSIIEQTSFGDILAEKESISEIINPIIIEYITKTTMPP